MKLFVNVDQKKAVSLLNMAKITLERLNETNLEKYPTNTIKDYYDVLHELMESLISLEGVKIKGEGAHKELIDYVCEKYNFELQIKYFLQDMRDYRNRISYEGFMIKSNYVIQNIEKIENIIKTLIDLINNKKTL